MRILNYFQKIRGKIEIVIEIVKIDTAVKRYSTLTGQANQVIPNQHC